MKKQILILSTLVLNIVVSAQVPFSLTYGECAVVYSLPKTQLCIEVQTVKVTQKQGMFYRYSERYLATNKVITADKIAYNLKRITVKSHTVADANRTYKFVSTNKKNSSLIHLSVNQQGILCGVNVPVVSNAKSSSVVTLPQTDNGSAQTLLPLGEEYMMAGSEAKLAEGAAKQIYRIRESRLGLLTADVEKLPADGASFASMLNGLNKMERELTELFVGKTSTEIQTQTIYLTPDSASTNQVLFRLSALRGIVPSDDLSGAPYYISIKPTIVRSTPTGSKAKKAKVDNEKTIMLYTILPASTQILIGDGIKDYYSGQFFIPQFGKVISLSEDFLTQKDIKITVDPQTGRLLDIK